MARTSVSDALSQNELVEFCAARARMYAFLAQLWREEAGQDLLDRIGEIDLPANAADADLVEGLARLKSCLAYDSKAILTDLAREYARLFLVAGRSESAFPYESVYTSGERLLMQDARDAVVEIYRAEGLARSNQFDEPEDHIAFELEFMAYLCRRAGDALSGNDAAAASECCEKQRNFVKEHLGVWAPDFCGDVLRLAKLDFYKGAAQLTRGFIKLDAEVSDALVALFATDRSSDKLYNWLERLSPQSRS